MIRLVIERLCVHGRLEAHCVDRRHHPLCTDCRGGSRTVFTELDTTARQGAIQWCETHESRFIDKEPDQFSMCLWMLYEDNWDALPEPQPCRFVPLLIVDAE
jgi:hypothetical protein